MTLQSKDKGPTIMVQYIIAKDKEDEKVKENRRRRVLVVAQQVKNPTQCP